MTTSRTQALPGKAVRTVAVACVAVLALSACGTRNADPGASEPPGASPDDSRSSPPRDDEPSGRLQPLEGFEPDVRWTESGFEVLAFGSGSCPPTASAVEVSANGTVIIEVGWQGDPDTPCTEDYGPSTSFIKGPSGPTTGGVPLTVRLRQDGALSQPIRVKFVDASAA